MQKNVVDRHRAPFIVSPLTIRRWHSYLSLLAAPSVLFFTLTGVLQLFGWHEAHGNYKPPEWLEKASSVHRDQVLERHEEKSPEAEMPATGAPPAEEKPAAATIALKAYFFWVGGALLVSTLLGAWMGFTQTPRKRLAWVLLIVGSVLPLGLLFL